MLKRWFLEEKLAERKKNFVSLQSILRCFANEGFGSAKFEQVRLCIRLALHLQWKMGVMDNTRKTP